MKLEGELSVDDIRKFFAQTQEKYENLYKSVDEEIQKCADKFANLPADKVTKEHYELINKMKINRSLARRTKLDLDFIIKKIDDFIKKRNE